MRIFKMLFMPIAVVGIAGCGMFGKSASKDVTRPTITSTNPANGDKNVALNKTITAIFSERMDVSTVAKTECILTGPGTTAVNGTVAYDSRTQVVTYTPLRELEPNTTFMATITIEATDVAGNSLAASKVWSFTTGTQRAQTVAQLPVPLGSALNFAILASSATANTPTSAITGDVGLTPNTGADISGFSDPGTCPEVRGKVYSVDASGPACAVIDPSLLKTAKSDSVAAFGNARASVRGTPQALSSNLGGLTIYPGLYEAVSSLEIASGSSLYLDAQGDPNAIFIIRSGTSITTGDRSEVVLTKGARAKNVYWTAGGKITLGTYSVMKGTLMAGTSISLLSGANLEGRALNQGVAGAAITLDSSTITVSAR